MELKKILQKKLNILGIQKQVTASQVCDAYNKAVVKIFGKDASEFTEAISFKNGVLKVRVANSAWAQEVQGNVAALKEIIDKKIDKGCIKRIIFNP